MVVCLRKSESRDSDKGVAPFVTIRRSKNKAMQGSVRRETHTPLHRFQFCFLRRYQTQRASFGDRRRAVAHVELAVYLAVIPLDGVQAQIQLVGNLLVYAFIALLLTYSDAFPGEGFASVLATAQNDFTTDIGDDAGLVPLVAIGLFESGVTWSGVMFTDVSPGTSPCRSAAACPSSE